MSPLQLSSRALAISESVTLAIAAKAAAMRKQGQDIISLGAGEPDFGTVEAVAAAGIEAIRNGQTRYTAAAGTPELREAAAGWFKKTYGLNYSPSQVMVTAGAKPAVHMGLMAIVEAGDTVLLPAPYWTSYPDLVRIAGGNPVDMPLVRDQDFIHTGEQVLAAAREHGAKGIILNYPNNPSGAVPTPDQLREIVLAAVEADLWILTDEIYGTMVYDGAEHLSPAAVPEAAGRVLVVNGCTKSHTLTGWRVGFLAGPDEIIAAAARLQSQAIGNPCTISQAALLEACLGDHGDELARRVQEFDERRRYIVDAINKIAGLSVKPPKGAFYTLVDAKQLCSMMMVDDVGLAEVMLNEALLAVVPGSAFAAPGFLRLSYSVSMSELERAMDRLSDWVARA